MSELINAPANRNNFRGRLLTSVSAFALLGSVYAAGETMAADDDADQPTVWIELGGQLERVDGAEDRFAPSFTLATPRPRPETISPLSVERPPQYSTGGEGKISFEPSGSDWVFSAAVRFGRSSGNKHVHQESYPVAFERSGISGFPPLAAQFSDTQVKYNESHTILDFSAGKDVGLGIFGGKGSSVLGLGVRFAQFATKSNIALKSDPDWHFHYKYFNGFGSIPITQGYHNNVAQLTATRSFHGVGPSLSWNASTPIAGGTDRGEIALDWGLNAAVLFGRQRAVVHHQSTTQYHFLRTLHSNAHYYPPKFDRHDIARAHTVTVPNVSGFAGVSFRYSNAKVSFGYRGDLFFEAMDGGIDTAKRENVGFYGPFASVSVGIGG